MKKNITMTIILLVTILNISLFGATDPNDNYFRKQCQFDIYGNGKNDYTTTSEMSGLVGGMLYMTHKKDTEEFAKTASYGVLRKKACQNTLNNDMSKYGFFSDYKWELRKIINKKY